MTASASEILRDALALPADDRAYIAAELLASLDSPAGHQAEIQVAWAAEIERRANRVVSGSSTGEPWEVVRERITRRLASE